ncbi:MAG: 30S ribosomal protein S5 [bacterium]|nr:30S ribosomal protein S5 [bacterium]
MTMRRKKESTDGIDERVLHIRRVSKKTTGGNSVTFSSLVAVGDGKGKVGIGLGRGREVPQAINKGISHARRAMVTVPIFNESLPHEITVKFKSARVLLKPAPPGTGLKVGGVVRVILDIAGVSNASGKIMGSRNQITNAYAVIEALKQMKERIKKSTKSVKSV